MNENRLPDYLNHMLEAASDACGFVEGLAKEAFLKDKRTHAVQPDQQPKRLLCSTLSQWSLRLDKQAYKRTEKIYVQHSTPNNQC